jgi:hypothetical protein
MGIFGDDISKAITESGDTYTQWEQKALDAVNAGQTQGRGDISDALSKALGYYQPYSQAGQAGLSQYLASLGLSGGAAQQGAVDKFRTSPGYQFALKQGLSSVQRSAAASGLGGSGAEQRELQSTGQGLADKEYGQWQSKLADLAGMGERTAQSEAQMQYGSGGQLAQLGYGYTGMRTGIYGDIGKSQAEERMAQAAAKAKEDESMWGGLGSIAGAAAKFFIKP